MIDFFIKRHKKLLIAWGVLFLLFCSIFTIINSATITTHGINGNNEVVKLSDKNGSYNLSLSQINTFEVSLPIFSYNKLKIESEDYDELNHKIQLDSIVVKNIFGNNVLEKKINSATWLSEITKLTPYLVVTLHTAKQSTSMQKMIYTYTQLFLLFFALMFSQMMFVKVFMSNTQPNFLDNIFSIRNINIGLFLIFLMINFCQPLIVDDLCRGASNLSALYNHTIIEHLIGDFYNWTGRLTAQFLAYIFFNKPYEIYSNIIFNFINAFFMISFFNLIFNISVNNQKDKKTNRNYAAFAFIFLFILVFSGFFKNALWKTVGLQYFWGIWLISWLYTKLFFDQKSKFNNKYIMLLSGLFIGLYNEIYFAILLIFIFGYLFNCILILKTKYNKNIIFGLIGNIIGGMLLVIAPGNYARQKIIDGTHHITLGNKFHNMINSYFDHTLFLVLCLIAIICVITDKNKIILVKTIILSCIISMIFIILPVGNIILSERMLMLQITICSIIIFQYIFNSKFANRLTMSAWIISLSILLTIIISAYYSLFKFNQSRYQQINIYHQVNNQTGIFSRWQSSLPDYVYFDDIDTDDANWKNVCFSRYYDFKKVQLKK